MERVSFWQEVRDGYKAEFPVWVLPAWFVIGTFAGQQLLVDRTFSNIVAGRWAAADDVLRVHTSLAELTDEILRLISKRLGEAGE